MPAQLRFFLPLLLLALPLHAEEADKTAPQDFWHRDTLTGDWGGLRTHLNDTGLSLSATEILDAMGNVSGGVRQDGNIMGRLELDLDTDFEKLAGLKGLTAHISAYELHGRGITANNLGGNFMDPSNIEAERSFRLFDFWFDQSMLEGDADLRFGQIAADDEFAASLYGELFLNAEFGWPGALATDFPSGGPAFPLATPGIRLRVGQNKPWSVMAAVFNGDPAPGPNTAQSNNASGTNFMLDHGALVMTEAAYTKDGGEKGLSGTYKLGAWYHNGVFGDLRSDTNGLSLANPGSNGTAAPHHGNYGIYGIIDQQLWRGEGGEAIGGFVRGFVQPDDRNLAFWQADVGANVKGLFFGRGDDTLGLAFSYLKVSPRAAQLDEDSNFFNGTAGPERHFEAAIELTYQAVITPWLTLQPDFQYIFHPGGNVANPLDSGITPIHDAAVFGLRTAVRF